MFGSTVVLGTATATPSPSSRHPVMDATSQAIPGVPPYRSRTGYRPLSGLKAMKPASRGWTGRKKGAWTELSLRRKHTRGGERSTSVMVLRSSLGEG
jgi:hypothetical protein